MTAWGWKPPFKHCHGRGLSLDPPAGASNFTIKIVVGQAMGEMKNFRLYRPSKEQPKDAAPQPRPRKGPNTPTQPPARSGSSRKPRQAPRFSLPFGASAPRARFQADNSAETPAIQAHLWNVSEHGSCLTVQGPLPLTAPVLGQLEFTEPGGRGTRRLPAELRWISTVGEATFFGLRFLKVPLPADTHLREFMQQSWTDQVPGSFRSGS